MFFQRRLKGNPSHSCHHKFLYLFFPGKQPHPTQSANNLNGDYQEYRIVGLWFFFFSVVVYFLFYWVWGLNSGLHAGKAGALHL
jgi:hypothetical protein